MHTSLTFIRAGQICTSCLIFSTGTQSEKKRKESQLSVKLLLVALGLGFFFLSFFILPTQFSQVCSCLLVQREERAALPPNSGAGAAGSCQNQPPAFSSREGRTGTGGI